MTTATSTASSVIEKHRRAIQAVIASKGRDPKAYTLSMLEKWNHTRLPIIAADPTKAYFEQRFVLYFAVLPDGTLVSAYDVPFERIMATAFRGFTTADAKQVAQLATMFGNFGQPIGFVTDVIRPGSVSADALPRRDAKFVMKRDGALTTLEFFTYQSIRAQTYDCRVQLRDGKAEFTAHLLVPKKD